MPVVIGLRLEACLPDCADVDEAARRLFREIELQLDLVLGLMGMSDVSFAQQFAREQRPDER